MFFCVMFFLLSMFFFLFLFLGFFLGLRTAAGTDFWIFVGVRSRTGTYGRVGVITYRIQILVFKGSFSGFEVT